MRGPGKTEMVAIKKALNPTDEELATRAAAGSRRAFEELVSRYGLRLFYFLRSRSGSDEDVEDLVRKPSLKPTGTSGGTTRSGSSPPGSSLWPYACPSAAIVPKG